jgi:UDP-N-acetylmuramyl pentapeptide phosphotransferase/UDP-N-acetylglucosamine-1-phosphate transferase
VTAVLSIGGLAPLASALSTFALLAVLLRHRGLPLDRPNERSLHSVPIPRAGGLAVVPAIAVGWMMVPAAVSWYVWVPALLLFGLSFLDDMTDLPIALRLLVHLAAASLVAVVLILPNAGPGAALVGAFMIAWMTNLYNFMDGSDGLAGGMTLFGFCCYAIAAWMGEAHTLALACVSVAAASAVFLRFNFYPARVFLGDAGSIPIGFLAAALGAQGWIDGLWPAWFPLLVFSPFIVDASVTLTRRILRREKFWQAHRDHYYQHLVRHGWGHRRTAVVEYTLMLYCGALALIAVGAPPLAQYLLIATLALSYLVLIFWVERICKDAK